MTKALVPPAINMLGARAVALEQFDKLPDDALVGYTELALLTGRSEDTLRQARRLGKLPIPKHPGCERPLRFQVRDVRRYLRGEAKPIAA